MKNELVEKNGFTHVILINSISKLVARTFEVETKYTTQMDNILLNMQKDGYEIVSIKYNYTGEKGLALDSGKSVISTLITYK